MKKITFLLFLVFVATLTLAQNKTLTIYYDGSIASVYDLLKIDSMVVFNCGTSQIKYESKYYNTVLIGSQCWLKENLDLGTMINGSSNQTDNSIIEKYCYNNDPNNCITYGAFYQWDEAMQYITTPGIQGICPDGWHIPTLAELETLAATVNYDGNALKEIGEGIYPGEGTNTSGFSALLAGHLIYNANFSGLGNYAIIWSSTEYSATEANYPYLTSYDSSINLVNNNKGYGFSVRCIKD